MFEVVLIHEDGSDCTITNADDTIDATVKAMDMYESGHRAILRRNGHIVARWLGTHWSRPIH